VILKIKSHHKHQILAFSANKKKTFGCIDIVATRFLRRNTGLTHIFLILRTGINSVDFDTTGTMILGTSNDFATRVWTVVDQRLRVSAQ
jgi:hypothetical protein